ncbi:MAG TPA: hypothetical protein ENK57_00345 [Polyangiaceae bacterium]|nr:hypothetical protein [Polyangiaceae bacterium]
MRTDSDFWRRALEAGVTKGPEPWLRYSPPVFGLAFGAALTEQRRLVAESLRHIRGPAPKWRELAEVAQVFTTFASSMTEAMIAGSGRGYRPVSRPVGDWNFMRAAAAGGGVIVATAQTAGWDVAGSFLRGALHLPSGPPEVWVLMAPEPDEASRQRHDRYREAAGVRIVHVGQDPLSSMPVLGHLRRGGIVALKFDRVHPGMRTREVTLFGRPCSLPEGPLQLAALSGAPIVPVLTRRLGFMEYEVTSYPGITLPRRPSEADRQAVAERLALTLERFVRAHPTQWFPFGRQTA